MKISTATADAVDIVAAILPFADHEEDTLRCAALRALAGQGERDPRARSTALAALLDPDPDVRTDAMDALRGLAQPEDAGAIRRSLQGDPVREVKEAALAILGSMRDAEAFPLIERLVRDRAEDCVTWEDEAGTWDEWLEIQAFAVTAAGRSGAADLIPALLEARGAAGGDLDHLVFRALAQMGEGGMTALLDLLRSETGLGRKRVLDALSRGGSGPLRPHLERICSDDSASVRALALPLIAADDPRALQLALHEPDADLRARALSVFAPARPELALAALGDAAEKVQAVALTHLAPPLEAALQQTLCANLRAWLSHAGSDLTVAAAGALARLDPTGALADLSALATDADRPLDARMAAAREIATLDDADATEVLVDLLGSPAAQVRLVALTGLRDRLPQAPDRVHSVLCSAIRGVLLPDDPSPAPVTQDEESPDAGAGRGETAQRAVRISEDGEIIPADALIGDGAESTLEQITRPDGPAENPPSATTRAARRRVSVEGPLEIGDDLRRRAIALSADVDDEAITEALIGSLGVAPPEIARAAFQALVRRADDGITLPESARDLLAAGLLSEDPEIRCNAVLALAGEPGFPEIALRMMSDPDALVRAAAVEGMQQAGMACPSECLSDPARPVRLAALTALLAHDAGDIPQAATRLVDVGDTELLGRLVANSRTAAHWLCSVLATSEAEPRILLTALARAG